MIYLIKSPTYTKERGFFFILKIGYTDNLKRRMDAYSTHCPDYKLIKTIEGDQNFETELHKYFAKFNYKNEWFEDAKEIYDFFDNPKPTGIALNKRKQVLGERGTSNYFRRKYLEDNPNCSKTMKEFAVINDTMESLKYICKLHFEGRLDDIKNIFSELQSDSFTKRIQECYEKVGPEKCKAFNYNIDRVKRQLEINSYNKGKIKEEVLSLFKVGDKYTKAYIKKIVADIYSKLNYDLAAKASDISNYFELKTIKLRNNGIWVNGFELLKKKEEGN